jgi:hypothetical protein
LVASSFGGLRKDQVADENPTCRRGDNRRWPPRARSLQLKGFWFWIKAVGSGMMQEHWAIFVNEARELHLN